MAFPKGKDTAAVRKQIDDALAKGGISSFISVDPASHRIGFAIFKAGKLIESGAIEAKKKDEAHIRIISIVDKLKAAVEDPPAILVIEKIRGMYSHAYLLWSIGAIIYGLRPKQLIEVAPKFWRSIIPEDYVKDDQADAIMIGESLIKYIKLIAKKGE